MMFDGSYWVAAHIVQHGIAFIYLMAFIVVLRQFRPLAGEDGLTPFTRVIEKTTMRSNPSIFHFFPTDRAVIIVAGIGTLLSALLVVGLPQRLAWFVPTVTWLIIWTCYLSIVNVGRIWWGYGWESMILEGGIIAAVLGGYNTAPSVLVILLLRWLLFRNMLGAGLIKLRGDRCWRELTCMDYHYETQPLPNPLSWFMHKLPPLWHRIEVCINHVVELVVPFLYFAPQPIAGIAGVATIMFQGSLLISGNYAWLNILTILLAFATIPDQWLTAIVPLEPSGLVYPSLLHMDLILFLFGITILLSWFPVKNMISPRQRMNAGSNPLHLVNTYGAFGSVTRTRYELIIEGRKDDGDWQPYRFYGKPTRTDRMPRQIVPYHHRLDWQLWFAAMTSRPRRRWIQELIQALLDGDDMIRTLMVEDPFDGDPPDEVRIRRFKYEFSSLDKLKDGVWWDREQVNTYYPATSQKQLEHGLF